MLSRGIPMKKNRLSSDSVSPRPRAIRRWIATAAPPLLLAAVTLVALPLAHSVESHPRIQFFIDAASQDEQEAEKAMAALAEAWQDSYTPLLVELAQFMAPRRESRMANTFREIGGRGGRGSRGITIPGTGGGAAVSSLPTLGDMPRQDASNRVRRRLLKFLEEKTGQEFGEDLRAWRRWYWSLPYDPHPGYSSLKKAMYSKVDESMGVYFDAGGVAIVRLDEVSYSGMPPSRSPILDHPKHVPAAEADFLKDKHKVIGLEVRGEVRAYPEQILAFHELTRDELGGVELTIVNDFLCGTTIPYANSIRGAKLSFRPSGLVYRSNRMMVDEQSVTLWSTLQGRAVLGPLTQHNVWLDTYPVVTTTWGEWKKLHPDTTILSDDTGFPFDYSKGPRFQRYLDNDRLMFGVPRPDDRLKNKEPVLALTLRPAKDKNQDEDEIERRRPRALAVKADFLEKKENRVFHTSLAGRELVIVTSPKGANRVYEAGETRFVSQEPDGRLRDADGGTWLTYESMLVPEAPGLSARSRLPARRSFWFAWHAQFPRTELVK
jgi:hypothetical protein